MDSPVQLQVGLVFEGLVTDVTLVRLVLKVRFLMSLECISSCKACLTHATFVGLLSSVCPFMFLQLALVETLVAARATHKWLLSRVEQLVLLQKETVAEHFVAHITTIHFIQANICACHGTKSSPEELSLIESSACDSLTQVLLAEVTTFPSVQKIHRYFGILATEIKCIHVQF